MDKLIYRNTLFVVCISLPTIANSANIIGEWCENGGPYLCYPPIDNKNYEYTCTDSTRITRVSNEAIEFVTEQTVHYYSGGFKNGKTHTNRIKEVFRRDTNGSSKRFIKTEKLRDEKIFKELSVSEELIQLSFRRKSTSSDNPAVVGKINYQRCSDDINKKTFYTALVDCGGSGDYIAGVPAVVNNPLIWDLGEKSAIEDKTNCQIAARCWGGGWVAYAMSEPGTDSNKNAFGAACGTKNRHEAKQQAINSCRESGGTNCLSRVVSGYDNGSNELDDTSHKGTKVENCNYGNCKMLSSR